MLKSIKYYFILLACFLLVSLCCISAACALDISAGGEYDLAKVQPQVNIDTTEPVTLYGKLNGSIECRVAGVNLTLDSAMITEEEGCALSFTGTGNVLTLKGKNRAESGKGSPGIRGCVFGNKPLRGAC